MNVVAVSQRVDAIPERGEIRDALDQRLVTFLLETGHLPVPVPNGLYVEAHAQQRGHKALDAWLSTVSPRAIVLSGGNDIGNCTARDSIEGWLLDYARENKLPVLGICRGMQMMAHWAGADLCRVDGHVRTRHQLSGQISGNVNSYHDMALAGCPEGFEVLACSEDGRIEAIRHLYLPWEGWMWHPEREALFSASDIKRARVLFGT